MKHTLKKQIASGILLAGLSMGSQAGWVTGTIERTLSEGVNYGGCMILLSTAIGQGCPSAWVSLDCQGGYTGVGERNYSTALMAFSLNKQVSVNVDPTKKYNTYCVATRLDVLK